MATFLLELGTEELPADFVRTALQQLQALVRDDLAADRLGHGRLQALGTPRRLALVLHDLESFQADLAEERKGPPAAQAFREGRPTAAAIGFAKRCGVDPESLEVRDTDRGPFVFACTRQAGAGAAQVLQARIPAWIWGLQGRRFMRWGNGDSRFSRPLRWLVALLDDQVLPLTLEGCDPPLRSGRHSQGHRLQSGGLELAEASGYVERLAAVDVLVDRQLRGQRIKGLIHEAAAANAAIPDLPAELFEELVDLVEAPQLLQGTIDPDFLDLPAEVLATVMRAHQRYVPLLKEGHSDDPLAMKAHAVLLPRFLCVSNGRRAAASTIQRGNERVLRARLADARFFIQQDLAEPSIDRRDRLAAVTFAEGLGSLRDRCERLEWLTDVLLEQLGLEGATADHSRRAAHLCKHDLVSQMVGEFPELQGIMGAKYLLAEGEARPVALAVLEHYLPRGAGDALPASTAGAVVALAERLELLLSIFAKGERPSGSSDPYALRRAGNGLLQILWSCHWQLDLLALLDRACDHWAALFPHFAIQPSQLHADLAEFLRQRLVSLLEEQGCDADLVQAVAGEGIALTRILRDPADARLRVDLLGELRTRDELAAVQAVVTRAARLADKADLASDVLAPLEVVDPALFEKPCETAMLTVLQQLEPLACAGGPERYGRLASELAASAAALAAFFDGAGSVMVMVDDPAIRRNRLQLLAVLRNQASVLADFSRISG